MSTQPTGKARRSAITIALLAIGLRCRAAAIALPEGFQETIVLRDLHEPTAVRFATDGRVFVAEKSGIVKVFRNLGTNQATVFADLRTNVFNFWDRGLLALALHPDFPATPYVYVLYTLDAEIGGTPPRWGSPGATSDSCADPTSDGCVVAGRLSRLQAAGDVMTGDEVVLIENWCQQYPSTSVAAIEFGPDGAMYVSGGEGASFNLVDYGQRGDPRNPCGDPPAGVGGTQTPPTAMGGALRSQNLGRAGYDRAAYGGKILRIDPTSGAALASNPLAGSTIPGADRIVAAGFRQPYRMAPRPGTDEIWVADVGWTGWEEINRFRTGQSTVENFGWPCYEGSERQPAYESANFDACSQLYSGGRATAPAYAYAHSHPVVDGDGCNLDSAAVSGLAFYAGGGFGTGYDGALFFADYSRGCIWVLPPGDDGAPDPSRRFLFAADAATPVDIRTGPGSDVFYVDFGGGTLRRIAFTGGNRPPIARITADRSSGVVPFTVQFNASQSHDPDPGDTLNYARELDGDGAFDDSNAVAPRHTYANAGQYTARLRVSDGDGVTDEAALSINAGNNQRPTASILTPADTLRWRVGDTVAFSGAGSDPEDGTLGATAFSWALALQHCPAGTGSGCHTHPLQTFDGATSGTFTTPDHEAGSYVQLTLRVTDSGGLSASDTRRLDPQIVALRLESEPPGLPLFVGATSGVAPVSQEVIVASVVSISAVETQNIGCDRYDFSGWSDGGARTHEITAPATPATFTASFSVTRGAACTARPGTPTPTPDPGHPSATPSDPRPTTTPSRCVCDCNGSGNVTVDELVTAVGISLDTMPIGQCQVADVDGANGVTVEELVRAVNAALRGCIK